MTNCYDSDQFVLSFGSVTLGEHIHAVASEPALYEEPKVRNNFWSTTVILDGSYPAVYWMHSFIVFINTADRVTFANTFYYQSTHLSTIGTVVVKGSDGNAIISYGQCVPQGYALSEPQELLFTQGGLVEFKFLGNTLPTTLSTTTP